MLTCSERERGWLHPLRVTQQYLLASMAAWFSSTVTPPPQSPPSHPLLYLFSVNSSPRPGSAPQSLNSSSQLLCLPEDQCYCLRYVWLQQGLSDSLFHLGCHRSTVSLSALNVSPLTQTITLMWGLDPCFSSPTCQGQVQAY